jgi:hypothetical protein
MGHEVIVANVRELRAISHSDRKSDTVDAEKIAHLLPDPAPPALERRPRRQAQTRALDRSCCFAL